MSRVSFWATKKVPKRVKVTFRANRKNVSFWATKKVPRRTRISFRVKK